MKIYQRVSLRHIGITNSTYVCQSSKVSVMNSAPMNVEALSLFPNSDQFETCSHNAKSILLYETLVMEAQVHFGSSGFTRRNRNYSILCVLV